MKKLCLLFVSSAMCAGAHLQAQEQRPTTTPPRDSPQLKVQARAAAVTGCDRRVGILGSYFEPQMAAFLTASGLTVSSENAASIAGGSLANLDVLYLNRNGVPDAVAQAAVIEAWVRNGGVLITEFDATELLFNGTFGFFSTATLDLTFGVPSGTVCGGNTVNVTSPTNALAIGLPGSWTCSGDPIAVFKVYNEATLDPAVTRVARIPVDQNGDGADDPVVGTACVDRGVVVPFFTDFGDWQPLQNPRICPGPSCDRSIEDETLMLNAVCRVNENCRSAQDHYLCYKVRPLKPFEPRNVLVRNQFGDQYFLVIEPDTLCVPSTKKELFESPDGADHGAAQSETGSKAATSSPSGR